MAKRKFGVFVIVLSALLIPANALLFPLLFPLLPISIKVTFHSHPKPPPVEPAYHFETIPVYKEVVTKNTGHNHHKHSYGDGHHQGSTSYGDGYAKVYAKEPHIKGHDYAKGYDKGEEGVVYADNPVYKSPGYGDSPATNHKDTGYVGFPGSGTGYGTPKELPIASPPIIPGNTYADIAAAHKASNYGVHKPYESPKPYFSSEYIGQGNSKPVYKDYVDEHSATYLDDTNTDHSKEYLYPPPGYDDGTSYHRKDTAQPLLYAGFGSSIYGDSYAKIVYEPKAHLKVSISTYH